MSRIKILVIVLGVLALAVLAAAGYVLSRGISARDEPSAAEAFLARRMRSLAVPRSARNQPNPVPRTHEGLVEALAHFADHCASCHANDGSGKTEIGQNLYPRAPDMRLPATQSLSDGELFYIIENGIRLTGMPAWGSGAESHDGATASWQLVHFIRYLPKLTAVEIAEMERLNPKTVDELAEEARADDFLAGEQQESSPPAAEHQH